MIVKDFTNAEWLQIFANFGDYAETPLNFDLEKFVKDWRHSTEYRVLQEDFDSVETLTELFNFTLIKHSDFLNAYKAAMETEFNPLELTLIETNILNTVQNSGDIITAHGHKLDIEKGGTDTTAFGATSTDALNTFDDGVLNDTNRNTQGGQDTVTYDTTDRHINSGNDTVTDNKKIETTDKNTRKGFENIDYITAITAKYKMRAVSWYTTAMTIIADELCLSAYSFD